MTAANVWEKGMIARRGISNSMPTFSKVLKFKVMKPLVHAGEKAAAGDFDVELEIDSGGSDDSELYKLLLKVSEKYLDDTRITKLISIFTEFLDLSRFHGEQKQGGNFYRWCGC